MITLASTALILILVSLGDTESDHSTLVVRSAVVLYLHGLPTERNLLHDRDLPECCRCFSQPSPCYQSLQGMAAAVPPNESQ